MKLRIVGGALSGRRFAGPSGDVTRPTSERVREALSSALYSRGRIADARVLDLFAGTGALAFELLSRGAASATLVDRHPKAIRAMKGSAGQLGLSDRVEVLSVDLSDRAATVAGRLAGRGPFDLVLADPPYAEVELVVPLVEALAAHGALAAEALLVLEHARKQPPASLGSLASVAEYRYGDTAVQLLSAAASGEPE